MIPIAKISAITILDEGKPIFDMESTTVRIEDDAAGPFIVIEQESEDNGKQEIRLCFSEIKALHDAMCQLHEIWK